MVACATSLFDKSLITSEVIKLLSNNDTIQENPPVDEESSSTGGFSCIR